MKKVALAALSILGFSTAPAFAHIGIDHVATFSTGFFHPLGGIDHVLAMVAVGLYAASLGGRAIWLVPAAFVIMMIGGGALGYAQVPLPLVEQGIGLSVVVMGAMIAFGIKLPAAAAMALVAIFAIFHGHAHGSEGAELASFAPYAAGFVLATSLLHMVGIALGLGLDRLGEQRADILRRLAGSAGTLAGISLMSGWLTV